MPPNTDPVELLECDFTNTWYTFIKNTPSSINNTPSGPITCIPPPPPVVKSSTPAPTASPVVCPPNIASKPVTTPNYYYCVGLQKAQQPPNIWYQPTTWIAITVVVLLLAGIGYYFWSKNKASTADIDYSKYFKKVKGGYYFFN